MAELIQAYLATHKVTVCPPARASGVLSQPVPKKAKLL
jgi:hypothetical protein